MSDHVQPPGDYRGRSVGGGRYQLRDVLGKGGMASVHLAWDTVLERQVAIKTMHSELGREDAFRERFKREAQSVAKLTHTNIVSVYDTGEDLIDGAPVPYIVMEYVEGRPLRTELEQDIERFGAMPADKALHLTADVLAALDISHEMGLVHRDIKPGNVMLTRRNVVKVMDFGIARAMQSGVTAMTQTGMVVGTPQYLSPEQALGRGVDARSDLYSVGVMLFELLTGRLVFDAESALAIAYAHVQEEPPAPSTINASVPRDVDALVARALQKNPNDRFPSAEAFAAECRRVAGTLSGAAPQIVPGAQAPGDSGAAVSNAVFPQFGGPTPPPGHTYASPYAPTPPVGGYGYPQQTAPSTPPPYAMVPPGGAGSEPGGNGGSGGGAGRGNGWMVMTAAAVAIALVAVVAVVVMMSGGDDGGGGQAEGDPSGQSAGQGEEPDPSQEPTEREPRYTPGDPEQAIETSACVGAGDYYNQEENPGAVSTPDFYDFHIDSVKACMREAGWTYNENLNYKDEVIKGDGMVVDQSPAPGEPYVPGEDEIELTVSTGNEPTNG
ncbi:Stk1 family PASTA domain-containing Ser/Thr kinase [Streptomyces sp. MP131-18]|uniref:Stk1 family PASTA domain-containing Ser/Thr kinase n=1 Tax=Streptomyces sp. MP131-18 TaxID=1857892 RepID=UPI00097C3353|nr:Stk1 family PASTA domain-containing Ser/Thr kinase [Streptomyces sp. MP131-18]ONK12907.1 Serine/threonine-protein kinase PknB [Streptomyces sp. MP131-18]